MKIRYYLRGLGLGILVTAVFFLLGDNSGKTMSDEMIKERAKELGMIESTVLADVDTNNVESDETTEAADINVTTSEEVSETTTETEAITETEALTEVESISDEAISEEITSEETISETENVEESEEITESSEETELDSEEVTIDESAESIKFVVNKGEGSDTVSQHLYEAGLIEDPYAYDKYLMQNGYDRRIGAGEHLIPSGSSWQEIAQILCS